MFGISESMRTVTRHYKEGNFNWPMIIYITLAHVAAVIGLFTIGQCHKYTLLWAFILWPIRLMTHPWISPMFWSFNHNCSITICF